MNNNYGSWRVKSRERRRNMKQEKVKEEKEKKRRERQILRKGIEKEDIVNI